MSEEKLNFIYSMQLKDSLPFFNGEMQTVSSSPGQISINKDVSQFEEFNLCNVENALSNLILKEQLNEPFLEKGEIQRVGTMPEGGDVFDIESSDDEFEYIMEQELIKEQIKRNIMTSSNDDDIVALIESKNGDTSDKQKLKLICDAIRVNRKLAELCVSLEAYLIKERSKLISEMRSLKYIYNTPKENEVTMGRGFYTQFGAPYFKDTYGFFCPMNQDFNEKLQKKQYIGYLYMQNDHTEDIFALSNAIREYIIDDHIKKSSLKALKKRHVEDNSLVTKNMIKKEIASIEKEIDYMKKTDLRCLVKDISVSDIDWKMISSNFSLENLSPGECLRYWNLVLSPKFNRGSWKQHEKKELKSLAKKYDYQNWDKIAELLNTQRTGYECFIQYKKSFGMLDYNTGRWSEEEDAQLSYLVSISDQGGVIGWAKVLYHLEDRTMAQALNRWYRLDPNLKKGKFTDEEDIILTNAVEQFGLDFQKVASVFPNRSAIQLRERFFAKKDMKVNKCGEWSLAEDKLLMDLVAEHGEKKWSKIAQNFPNRNRIQIRHRYKCIKLNLLKDPSFTLENLNRFKRNTHINVKNKRDEEAISKSTAINIISKTIEEGKIFNNKRRILKRTAKSMKIDK